MVRLRCGYGAVEVRSWYGRGTVAVRSWYGRGALVLRSRYGRGSVAVRSWYGRGAVKVLSRYAPDSLVVRHACYSHLDAPRTWYMHYNYDLLFAVRSGTLWVRSYVVRSWYGTLKVHSCLVFSTSLEPGTRTVRSIVRVVQSRLSWIRFARFRPR